VHIWQILINFESLSVVVGCFLWPLLVIEGIAHADQSINIVWTLLEGSLVILGGFREVVSLEQKVTHGDETWNIVPVDIETFLEGLSGMLQITGLEVDLSKLTVGLVMVLVLL
jgi:hypothetical protein